MNRNQHYEFWVSYYQELYERGSLSDSGVEHSNKGLTGHCWVAGATKIPMQEQALCFKVLYPGMLVGLGNTHFSQSAEGEIKLGFTFDPVTGLPYLPGSSVKGILRSAFLANWEYVKVCLTDLRSDLTLDKGQVKALELDIFGDNHPQERKSGKGIGNDIFFDAYPVKADNKGHLLGMESITPHLAKKPELQGLTSPNPLSLLKIMPGVVMQFRFKLTDSEIDGITISADTKKMLFQTILEDFGVGAKTNVGFGGLEHVDDVDCACYLTQKEERTAPAGNRPIQREQPRPQKPRPQNCSQQSTQQVFTATVTGIKPFGVFIRLDNNAGQGMVHIKEIANEYVTDIGQYVSLGDKVKVVEIDSNKAGKRAFSMKRVR